MAIKMSKLAAALALACVVPMASASVLTFEDLAGSTAFFTSNYHGFTFGNNDPATNPWFYTNQVSAYYAPSSGVEYVAVDFSLYDNTIASQATLPISSTTAFTFQGAYFSGGDQIYYQLYNGNSLVFTSTPSATLTASPSFVSSGYNGLITSVVIFGRQGYYAMDDFTYNAAPVPEPGTYALMAAGLAGVGFMARRRRG